MRITKKIALLLCLLTFTGFVNAQITVTGKVVDNTNVPIEFANVVLTNKDKSNIITGTISDEKGNFTIKTDINGEFNLQISFVGFEEYTKTVNSTIDLGKIILNLNIELNEVVIIARKKIIERKGNKLIFNVKNTHLKSGYDGIEVLKRTPSVVISRDNILIKNKNATVLVNGRTINLSGDELSNYIKSIDVDNIKKIEVQTESSVNMDANTQGGVINFVLKNNVKGLNTQIKYYHSRKGILPSNLFSLNLNYGSEKWNIYNSVSYHNTEDRGNVISGTNFNSENRIHQEKGEFDENTWKFVNRLGLTYQISQKQELGIELYNSINNYQQINKSNLKIFENNSFLGEGNTFTPTKRISRYLNLSANYSIKLDSIDGRISFITDYAKQGFESDFNSETTYLNNFLNDIKEKSNTNALTNIYSTQIDFNKTIKSLGEIKTGVKLIISDRENETIANDFINGNFIVNNARSSNFDYTESIYAGYFLFSKKLWKEYTINTGLRVEKSSIKGIDLITNERTYQNYLDYFPSVFFMREFSENRSVSFNYNRKIDRPSFRSLNPYVNKLNDFSFQIGNPNLKPQYRNNFDLSYNLKNHSFSTCYNTTKNLIDGVYFSNDNIAFFQPQNIGTGKIIGLDYNYNNNIKKWWYLKFSLIYNNEYFELSDKTTNNNSISFFINNDFTLKNNWSINLSAYYTSPFIEGNYLFNEYFESNFMVQKTFLNNNLKIRFYVDDIFNTQRDKNKGIFNDFTYNFYQKRQTQTFTIYALFIINSKNKIRERKNKTSNDTKNRL